MSYKSYAQPGQFGTYSIDLPIKAEINEDLRAAGDFAAQMERSQNYREKWAGSYLSALNKKSGIERQNRDDNFEFLQNNFKRIYEGEQREFEGRLAELRREQAEAAQAAAEPSTIEKVFGFMQAALKVAGTVEGIVQQHQAAQFEQNKEAASASMEKLAAAGAPITGANLNNWRKTLTTGSDQEIALRTLREQYPTLQKVSDQDILNVAAGSGRMHQAMQVRAYQQHGASYVQRQLLTATAPGGNHESGLDPTLPQNLNGANGYSEKVRQYQRKLRNEWTGGEVSDEFLVGTIIPNETKLANSLAARNSQIWGKQSAAHNIQLEVDSINSVEIMPNPSQSLQNIWENQIGIFNGDVPRTTQWLVDRVTSEGSSITAGTYETWLNKLIDSSPHPPGGKVQQKLRSALTHLQQKGFDSIRHLTNLNEAKENQKLLEIDARLKAASPAAQQDIFDEIRTTDWSGTSRKFQTAILAMATPQGQRKYTSPTFNEITGVTDSKLEKSVETWMLGRVGKGAYFNNHGKTEAVADGNFPLARGFIIAETKRIWGETEKNFPAQAGNKDIILQKAISQAVENVLDGPNPKISLDNGDLTDPAKPIRFNVGKAFSGRTTADFYNDIIPFKDSKTIPKGQFPELTGRDGEMIDMFALRRNRWSRVKGGPVEIQHVVAVANSQWATELSKTLGITRFEAVDQGLRSRGHKGLDPANMVNSAQAEIHDRYVADLVDGAKTINTTGLEIRRRALNNTLGGTPSAPYMAPSDPRLSKITPPILNRPYQVTPEDNTAILSMASQFNLDPRGLAALFHLESGFDPNNWGGDGGNYVGIIQFGSGARSETGLPATKAQWKNMTLAEQIPYAMQYLKGRGLTADRLTADPWHNLSLVYMTILNGNPDSDPTFKDSNDMSVDTAMRDYFRPGTRTYNEAQQIMGWGN